MYVHCVFSSKSTCVMTIFKYTSLVFLLFLLQIPFTNASSIDAHNDDRCELKGFFGVTHDEPDQSKLKSLGYEVKGGTIVTNVIGCTAALNAGIQPMDYLFEVNGKTTSSSVGFFCLLADFNEGESFEVGLLRMGKKKTVTATLGRRGDACHGEHPFPKRGFFGIHDTDSDTRPGTLIDVSSSGPVAMLGLEDGDRLLRINGYAIADWSDLSIVKRLISDVDNVSFDVIRDGQDMNFTGAIPEQQHQTNWIRSTMTDCSDEMDVAFEEMDKAFEGMDKAFEEMEESFAEMEESFESAFNSKDIREGTSEVVEDVMEAVREVFGSSRSANRSRGSRIDEIDPIDMDARVESMSESDFSTMETLVDDMPKNRDLKVNSFATAPNPNEGRFRLTFELPSIGDTQISIYSASGREIYGYDLGDFTGSFSDELDIMRNGPGTYFLVVRQDEKAFVRKIILIKR